MCISLFKVFNILFRRKVDFSKKKIKYNTWLSNFRSIISQVVTYGKLNAKKSFGKSAIQRVFNLEIKHILRSLTQILSIKPKKLKTFQKRMNEQSQNKAHISPQAANRWLPAHFDWAVYSAIAKNLSFFSALEKYLHCNLVIVSFEHNYELIFSSFSSKFAQPPLIAIN